MIFANIFESIGCREMGRKSSIEFGKEILEREIIAAVLILSGNYLSDVKCLLLNPNCSLQIVSFFSKSYLVFCKSFSQKFLKKVLKLILGDS